MKRNGKGEEVSARTLKEYLERFVLDAGGVVSQAELERAIARDFHGIFGPEDRRPHGKSNRPKWLNTLDWAKVMARRLRPPILNRSRREDGKRVVYLVRCAKPTPTKWVRWVKAKAVKRNYRKRCEECGRYSPLAAKTCQNCPARFPEPSRRRMITLA